MKAMSNEIAMRASLAIALGVLIFSAGLARAQGTFPGRSWPAGIGANSIAVADFNRDGRPDLASCSSYDQTFGVLRSTGLGLFSAYASQPLGNQPLTVQSGDFNGDGIPDLVGGLSSNIAVSLGIANGTLAAPAIVANVGAYAIATCDFDHDAKLDLALANIGNMIQILRGTGAGTFNAPINIALPAGDFAWDVAIGDLSGDGVPDLVVGFTTQTAGGWLWMQGLGGFAFGAPQSFATNSVIKGIKLAQLDGNATLDVAAAAGSQELVFFNAGAGVFGAPLVLNANCYSSNVEAADLDRDGRQDLIFGNTYSGGLEIFRALSGGGFSAGVGVSVGSAIQDLVAADINGDGLLDLALAHNSGVVVLLGDGSGSVQSLQSINAPFAAGLDTADMNGDGIKDMVSAALYGTTIEIRLGNGTGGFGPPVSFAAGGQITVLVAGKINTDNFIDVAAVDLPGNLHILLGNGAGALAAPLTTLSGGNVGSLTIADLNGDGKADVAGTFNGGVGVYFGDGAGGMSAATFTGTGLTPATVAAGDLDGDGDIDLACANPAAWSYFLLFNNGSGVFSVTSINAGSTTNCLGLADLDGDGALDLVVHGATLMVLRGLGGGAFAPATSYPSTGGFKLAIADFDGDSKLDVASVGERLELYSGDGAGGLTNVRGFMGAAGPIYSMATADVDGNGRLDILTSNQGLTLHVNLGEQIGPTTYCTAKVNSLGCTQSIGWSGASSASASSGFTVRSTNVRNNKAGLLMYGVGGRSAVPFSGGIQCVHAAVKRSLNFGSSGSPSGADCSGVYSIDMNAFAAGALGGNPLPALSTPGTGVTAQFWGRDPGFAAPNNTSLSNAIEYVVGS